MSPADQCYFWMNVDLSITPRTDFTQIAQILPWSLKQTGFEQYMDALNKAIEETGIAGEKVPEKIFRRNTFRITCTGFRRDTEVLFMINEFPGGFVPGGRSAGERIPTDRFSGHKISGMVETLPAFSVYL